MRKAKISVYERSDSGNRWYDAASATTRTTTRAFSRAQSCR
jgi:hypothetical protein